LIAISLVIAGLDPAFRADLSIAWRDTLLRSDGVDMRIKRLMTMERAQARTRLYASPLYSAKAILYSAADDRAIAA
jgi:hypothetical protein